MKKPKATKAQQEEGKLAIEQPPPVLREPSILTLEERRELRLLLNSPTFVKAWHIASMCKPSVFPAEGFNTPIGQQSAYARIHELRGWDMFGRAIVALASEPRIPQKEAPINFPEQ